MKLLQASLSLLLLGSFARTAQAQWSTDALSSPRYQLSSASLGSKVFFAGGYTSATTASSVVDIYDVVPGTWTAQNLSLPRGWMASATVGDKAFFACGRLTGSGQPSNRVDIYDNSTDTWSTHDVALARYGCAAATLGDKLYIAGGIGAAFYARIDIYDDSSGTWSTDNLSVGRGDLTAAVVGQKILFAGGWSVSGASDRVDIFDSSTSTWSTASLSVARERLSAVTVGDKVLFAGGGDSSPGIFDTVDIYDNSTDSWSTATLAAPREFMAATSVGPLAVFAGGYDGTAPGASALVDMYDSNTGVWTTSSLSSPRWGMAGANVAHRAYFGGGLVFAPTSLVDVLTTSGGTGTVFCTGDSPLGSTCRCLNENDDTLGAGAGCANSAFSSGAQLLGSGLPSVINDGLTLLATGVPPNQPGLFFQGNNAINGGGGLIFGDGLRCAGGSVMRLGVVAATGAGNASSFVNIAAAGGASGGDVKRYQFWYRDPLNSPCGLGFNLTNGLEVAWFN